VGTTSFWSNFAPQELADLLDAQVGMMTLQLDDLGLDRRLTIDAYLNNHYSGCAYGSARLFSEMWERKSGKGIAEIARPTSEPAQHTNLF